jgi:hypothetical protein
VQAHFQTHPLSVHPRAGKFDIFTHYLVGEIDKYAHHKNIHSSTKKMEQIVEAK